MKIFFLTMLGFCLVTSLPAQGLVDDPPAMKRTAAELDELLGPIALYPDALISLILPASTAPLDIVLGARFVASDGDPERVDDKRWDASVKSLTRYPDTLKWLDENLEWTAQVGDAFIAQPVEVMESIQHLRTMARAMGNLVDTPQQRIVMDDTYIRIIPSQPDYIYEPRYDPEIIYYERPISGPLLFFSLGFGVGSWLNYDFDWHRHRLYRGDWHEGWDYHRDSDRRNRDNYFYINNNITNSREWQPDRVRYRTQSNYVAERISSDLNSSSRTSSRNAGAINPLTTSRESSLAGRIQSTGDLNTKESPKHHPGIARPKPIASSPQHADGVKRNEQNESLKGGIRGRADNATVPKTLKDNNPEGGLKSRVAKPNSVAPGIPGDGKDKNKNNGRDGGERKGSANDSSAVSPRMDVPSKKQGDVKGRSDMSDSKREDAKRKDAAVNEEIRRREDSKRSDVPKHEESQKKQEQDMPKRAVEARQEAPRKVETPKREEPKRKEAPKQEEARKNQDVPKRQEAPRKVETPKREEPQKKQESPKRPETARREEPKKEQVKPAGPSEADKAKAKAEEKKKEEEKKKK